MNLSSWLLEDRTWRAAFVSNFPDWYL